MRELLEQLMNAIRAGRRVACCRLVETRGSTPQKPGAAMLVFEDGSQAGTLGGGCVEAEVKRQALAIMNEGEAQVVSFQLDDDYGWDDGLICGGRMQVLIDPVADSATREYFGELDRLSVEGGTEAIVFDAEASGLTSAASYLFDADGKLVCHLRGPLAEGEAPPAVVASLKPLSERPRPSAGHGVAYLPILPRCRLIIVGGGHVGQAVGQLAADLDFDVWVVDDREVYVSESRFPSAQRRIAGTIPDVLPKLDITREGAVWYTTRSNAQAAIGVLYPDMSKMTTFAANRWK